MKMPMTICFTLALLTFGVASAQDNMHNDNMKGDASMKAVHVTGKVSDDGKTFVGDHGQQELDHQQPRSSKRTRRAPRHPDSTM
jgi:hypothetical protein